MVLIIIIIKLTLHKDSRLDEDSTLLSTLKSLHSFFMLKRSLRVSNSWDLRLNVEQTLMGVREGVWLVPILPRLDEELRCNLYW